MKRMIRILLIQLLVVKLMAISLEERYEKIKQKENNKQQLVRSQNNKKSDDIQMNLNGGSCLNMNIVDLKKIGIEQGSGEQTGQKADYFSIIPSNMMRQTVGRSIVITVINMPLVDCSSNFDCKYCPKDCFTNPFPKDTRCPDCLGADKTKLGVCPVVDCVKNPSDPQCCL